MIIIDTGLREPTRLAMSQPVRFSLTLDIAQEKLPEVGSEQFILDALEGRHRKPRKRPVDVVRREGYAWIRDNPNPLLKVDARYKLQLDGDPIYRATCKCGNTVYLKIDGIKARLGAELGCAAPRCGTITVRHRVWLEPVLSLRMQAVQLVALMPELLPSSWAGKTVDEVVVDLAGLSNEPVDIGNGGWWITDISKLLSEAGGVDFGVEPDRRLFPGGDLSIRIGSDFASLTEMARTFGIPLAQLLELRLKYFDDQLMEELWEIRYAKRAE